MLQTNVMHNKSNILKQFNVILCSPSHAGNIGSTARAMKTMGLENLYLVNPKSFPSDQAYALAAGADDILDKAIIFSNLEIEEWGNFCDFDMIINATSRGLKEKDNIKINYQKIGENKFFYDVIYNPRQTRFLNDAKKHGNKTENGKMMFIYQAHQAFALWHKILPSINEETIQLLDQ